jgi:NAD(P)-dependent dehydrogenase (short-subunit alcohol dehydrogenase family)
MGSRQCSTRCSCQNNRPSAIAGWHPLGRMGRVDDIVAGVLYLEAATFVTGEFLHVDGGQSAGH